MHPGYDQCRPCCDTNGQNQEQFCTHQKLLRAAGHVARRSYTLYNSVRLVGASIRGLIEASQRPWSTTPLPLSGRFGSPNVVMIASDDR